MKHFMIKYRFSVGSAEAWHQLVEQFVATLDNDPDLKGRIAYRCMRETGGAGYYHLAAALDKDAISALQSKEWFKRYNEETRKVAGGAVEVLPLEIVAETTFHA